MEWWARIGVTKQYIMINVCKELFPELNAGFCWVYMISMILSFKPHVQFLLSVLTENETYLKSKFCKLQDDALAGYLTDWTDCNKCRTAKFSIAKGRINAIDIEFREILHMDFCNVNYNDYDNYYSCLSVVKDIVPRVKEWFQRYVNNLDELQFCGDSCTMEADSPQQIEGISSEDNNIEIGEMINNNLKYSVAAPSELEQPKTECDVWETSCYNDEDCKQCSDCPNGAYCIVKINYAGTKLFSSCECSNDYYEYDNSMDYFYAKSEEVQRENEEKIIELEELENSNLEYSEAAPSEFEQPKKECGLCSSNEDCKNCSVCPNGAYCSKENPYLQMRICKCVDLDYFK